MERQDPEKVAPTHLIVPHGGCLVDRRLPREQWPAVLSSLQECPQVVIDRWAAADLWLLGTGAYSPLTGFMTREDYLSCLQELRLADGTVWPLPITLPVSAEAASGLGEGSGVVLVDRTGAAVGLMEVQSIYHAEKLREARLVYGTTNPEHPGVALLYRRGTVYLGGPVWLLTDRVFAGPGGDAAGSTAAPAAKAAVCRGGLPLLTPAETRAEFRRRGWSRVVGFQTRNPLHRVHEYIQKCALEIMDGLLLHPLVGETKRDDVPAHIRAQTYLAVINGYFPQERVLLAGFPAFMRYAGPREALFHALVRKNYGCSHFIVGRDHAGVGDYYDPLAAHRIFDHFRPEELGIMPLRFGRMFYCTRCEAIASDKTCPHDAVSRRELSGTRLRALLAAGELPPAEFTRPEVAALLRSAYLGNP